MGYLDTGIFIALLKSTILVAVGILAFIRFDYLHPSFRFPLLLRTIGYGAASFTYNILFVLGIYNFESSSYWLISGAVMSTSFFSISLLFATLIKKTDGSTKRLVNVWLALAAFLSLTSVLVRIIPIQYIPRLLYSPLNLLYYAPRFFIFGTIALFLHKAIESKNLFLVGISVTSIAFLSQDALKLFVSSNAVLAIQNIMDTSAGLLFAFFMLAGLYQDKIDLAVYKWLRERSKDKAVELYISTIGFIQYLSVGIFRFGSKEYDFDEGTLLHALNDYLESISGKQKDFLGYQDLGSYFEHDQMSFISFVENKAVNPVLRNGKFVYRRDDLLRAIGGS